MSCTCWMLLSKNYGIKAEMSSHKSIKKRIYTEAKHKNNLSITATSCSVCKQTNKQAI